MKKTILLSALLLCSILISYGQWTLSFLTEAKQHMGSASLGTKAYFAGGQNIANPLASVEFFDTLTGEMGVIGDLSVARALPSAGSCGSKVFFAGGCNFFTFIPYSNLDIWDTLTQQWTIEQLSIPRFSIATVSKDNRILFAGGCLPNFTCYDLVEIYDNQTGTWEDPQYLSQARAAMASAVVGDLAIFAGGVLPMANMSDRVDIYNFSTNTWDTATLSEARGWASATTVNDKVLIAGGLTSLNNPSKTVDIYDATTGTWDIASLSVTRCSNGNAATVKGKAYFAGGGNFNNGTFYTPSNVVDIYDEDYTWSIDILFEPLTGHSVVGIGNYLIVAGGENLDGYLVPNVEIFYDPETGIDSHLDEDSSISVFPNPCHKILTINTPLGIMIEEAVIYNQTGQKVLQRKPVNNTLDISNLQKGIYIIELVTGQGKIREKLIVQ